MDTGALQTIPARRLIGTDVTPALDAHGFLAEEFAATAPQVDSLFDQQAVLVVGPPWSGKTFLAKALYVYLSNVTADPSRSPFGKNLHRTFFETHGHGAAIEPSWWPGWTAGSGRACWIVDALDEDARGGTKQMHEILNCIEPLGDSVRKRLLLLMFSRENEVPPDIGDRLEGIYGTDFETLRLAPVDAHTAGTIVEHTDPDGFDKVCFLVERNRLRSVASLPVVLEHLAKQPAGTQTTAPDVWRGVLTDILRDKRREERLGPAGLSPIDERFAATCRMAAALTFSGKRQVDAGLGESDGPSVEDLFPLDGASRPLRRPARESLRSAVFSRTGCGYRFAQFHVQEWFTAFALEDIPLNRLLPLVADGEGKPLSHYQGVLGLLHKVTHHQHVKEWIVSAHGGIPPRSNAAPWALDDALSVLNRLLELARTTQFVRPPQGLENLAAPSLGPVVADMVKDKERTLSERELLIDVAQAIAAKDTAPAAQTIIRDQDADDHLRYSAACLLGEVGSDQDLTELERFIEKTSPATRDQRAMMSVLIESLYQRGLWNWGQAAQHLPERTEHFIDSTALLEHHLLNEMTVDDARAFLSFVDWEALANNDRNRRPHPHCQAQARRLNRKFLAKGIRLIARQEKLSPEDYRLLLPVALSEWRVLWEELEGLDLATAFAKDTQARRELFMEGLRRDPQAKKLGSHAWEFALTGADLDWLAELCPDRANESPWLWTRLLQLSYRTGVSQGKRNAIRQRVRAAVPDLLAEFDANRRKRRARERRHAEREKQRGQKQEVNRYSLAEIVQETIAHNDWGLRDRMHRLGWCCFVEKGFRPNNVYGEWAELSPKLQDGALDVCTEALQKCPPTAIPEGSSFPGAILYEASVFIEVLRQSSKYHLDGRQVKKWLPAVLRTTSRPDETALARCFEACREATEDVLLDTIKGEMYSEVGSLTAGNLPSEYWSERFSEKAANLTKSTTLHPKARADLMRLLANRSPAHVENSARKWANLPSREDEATKVIRRAGLDAMLLIDPVYAVPILAKRFGEEGKDLLVGLTSLIRRHPGETSKAVSWPAPLIEILVDLLYEAFPPEKDPQYEGAHSVGPEDDLRWLRGGLVSTLIERGRPEDEQVLKRLADRHPFVRTWYANVLADRAAQQVAARMAPIEGPEVGIEGRVPVAEVVRLLEDAVYRLIRSGRDLQRVLLEEVREIKKDAKRHLALLYRPKTKKDERRKRLHEEALQAYFYCRLSDRLPDRVLAKNTTVFIDREPLANINQRLDIKVQAPTVEGKPSIVVIEVKWSDNKDVSLSLQDQLGSEYLLGQSLKHGIYLVGWCGPGTWKNHAPGAKPGRPYSITTWTDSFRDQARLFSESHLGIQIEPVVVDLRWSSLLPVGV